MPFNQVVRGSNPRCLIKLRKPRGFRFFVILKFAKKEVAAHSHGNLFFRLKYMLLKVEDQFDFVGMNCAMRPAKSAIF